MVSLLNPSPQSRGIRQGDPLSPFIFFIMVEGLGCYIKASTQNRSVHDLPLHGLQPEASHKKFVVDMLLINTPTTQEAIKLRSIPSDFSEASSTTFNLAKSQLFFFNTPMAIQHHLSQIMNTPVYTLPSHYMGLSLSDSAARNISWDSLLIFITNYLINWTFLSLNLPAKIVLLKSVLQAIPTYLFSALASPKLVIRKIRNMQRNFLWHGHNLNKKWVLVS
jgi:hypothetical protein